MFLFRSLHRQYPVLLYVIDLNPESVDHPKLQCFIHIFHWYAVLTAANIDVAVGTDDALLEPFGKGNTKPVFAARNVRLMDMRVIGRKKNVLKMRAVDANGNTVEAVYFGDVENLSGRKDTLLSITYYPTLNEYMGQATPQIVITHYQTA